METMDACLEPERISVILPVYNVEAYLDRCLESLVNQTYTALEILLIDDGSQDGSGELCDTWAKRDGRIRVWHRENGGAAAARNSGLDLATGDYILFVDADDYVDVDHCRVLMETIRGNPALDCVICGLLCVDDEGTVGEPQVMEERQFLSGLDVIKERYLKRDHRLNIITPWGKLFRRAVWEGLRFTDGLYYEDLDIMPYVFTRCGQIACVPHVGYYYYQRRGSASHGVGTDHKRIVDSLHIRDKHIRFYESLGERELAEAMAGKLMELIITSDIRGWLTEEQRDECRRLTKMHWKKAVKTEGWKGKLRYTLYRFGGRSAYRKLMKKTDIGGSI